MKIRSAFAAVSLSTLVLSGCARHSVRADGPPVTEIRTISACTAVEVSAPVDVQVIIDPNKSPELGLSAPREALPYLKTEVKPDGTLVIRVADGTDLDSKTPMSAVITLPAPLRSLALFGSGDAAVGPMRGGQVEVSGSGSGNIVLADVVAGTLHASTAGSGNIRILIGRVGNAHYEIAGSGGIIARYVLQDTVNVEIAGSGNAVVNANSVLQAEVAGSGSVLYEGRPVVEKDIAGSGTVRPLQ